MKALKEPTTNQAFLVIDLVDEGTPIKEAAQAAGVTVQQARGLAANETLRKAVKELTTKDKKLKKCLHCQWRKDGAGVCILPVCLRSVGKLKRRKIRK